MKVLIFQYVQDILPTHDNDSLVKRENKEGKEGDDKERKNSFPGTGRKDNEKARVSSKQNGVLKPVCMLAGSGVT